MGIVVVIPIVLRSLSNYRANSRASRPAHNRSLQTAAKNRAQRSATRRTNQRALAWTNPTLPVIVMVGPVVAVVVVAAAAAIPHAVVVGLVMMLLRNRGEGSRYEEKRSDQKRRSKLAHLQSDAKLTAGGTLTVQTPFQ